jgi:lactate permease
VLNGVFLYNITVKTGQFDSLRSLVRGVSLDRRVQVILIAFCFGGFVEGAAGFGTPVAITAALLLGLGFPPLQAAGLSLIANTAPVAFGSIGTPILALAGVTGLPSTLLAAIAGRLLAVFAVILPSWIVVAMSGWRGLRAVWPVALVAGVSFGVVQLIWSNTMGPELVDIAAGLVSLGVVVAFCRVWQPAEIDRHAVEVAHETASHAPLSALAPWLMLSVFVFAWGLKPIKNALNGVSASPTVRSTVAPVINIPDLHTRIFREFPVVSEPADRTKLDDGKYRAARAEAAQFTFNWLSATGTAILFAAIASAVLLRIRAADVVSVARETLRQMRPSLITIALMLALGFVTRYGGTDATLGLAFTKSGVFYPFFAPVLGWIGVALTGSDTSSNVLFGSLQLITSKQLGLSGPLMAAANSAGGVMGKMVDAQSIVISTSATGQVGLEGKILRFVFWHSIALVTLMGLLVMALAYLMPWMLP